MIKGFVRFGDDKPKELGWYCIKNISPNGYHWYNGATFIFNNEPMGVHDNVLWLDESEEQAGGKDSLLDGYKQWGEDVKRLTKEIDVMLNGKDAAEQASLCDIVAQMRGDATKFQESNTVIAMQQQEIERLKGLLREVCVRANIIFPEQEPELEWFDEQFKGQHELHINIGATLGLGEIDDESKADNEGQLEIIRKQFKNTTP